MAAAGAPEVGEEDDDDEEAEAAYAAAAMQAAREEMGGNMSREERLRWLQSQGVQVEGRLDRTGSADGPAADAVAPPAAASSGRRFSYVFLPADDGKAAEERTALAGSGDVLPQLLGPSFGSKVDDAVLRRTAEAHGQVVGLSALRAAAARGGADAFRLAAPSPENGREAVYAYLDDCASIKALPRNGRASALARRCGFPAECELHGDVYVGRVRWPEKDAVTNLDFTLQELDASALWQRRAPLENVRFQKETIPEAHKEAEEQTLSREDNAAGAGDGYTWQDSEEDVEITIFVRALKDDVKLSFKRQAVEMTAPRALRIELFSAVEPESCSWVWCPNAVHLTLPKREEVVWPRLSP